MVCCKVYDFKRGNFVELCSFLEYVFFDVVFFENIDEYWFIWRDLFLIVVFECVFIKIVKDINLFCLIDFEVCYCLRKKYIVLRKYWCKKILINKLKLCILS